MNPNEVRERLRMNPYQGGEIYQRPMNMESVSDPERQEVQNLIELAGRLPKEELEKLIKQAEAA